MRKLGSRVYKFLAVLIAVPLTLGGCSKPDSTEVSFGKHFSAEPVRELKRLNSPQGWNGGKEILVSNVGGIVKVSVLLAQKNENGNVNEVEACLKIEDHFFSLGMVSAYGVEKINTWSEDVNQDGLNELILSGPVGASAFRMQVIGPGREPGQWMAWLETGWFEILDLDGNGIKELVETSTGALPSYVVIHQWNMDHYEKMDVAEALGNEYAALSMVGAIPLIISGKPYESKYYQYSGGEMLPLPENFQKSRENLLPMSGERLLTEADVTDLSADQLAIAEEEIPARHGSENDLNRIEKQNAAFLKAYREKVQGRWQKAEGNSLTLDLNGDHQPDRIQFTCAPGANEFTLKVDQASFRGTGENLDGNLFIWDLDTKDPYKEIAITESGPSGDLKTYIYYYNGHEILYCGKIGGNQTTWKILGDGTLWTRSRGEVLHTWFYSDKFRLLPDHTLERVPLDLYGMHTLVRVKKFLSLPRSRSGGTDRLDLMPGQFAMIEACDNKSWCLVENGSGKQGWLELEGFSRLKDIGLDAWEVFDGLCNAD